MVVVVVSVVVGQLRMVALRLPYGMNRRMRIGRMSDLQMLLFKSNYTKLAYCVIVYKCDLCITEMVSFVSFFIWQTFSSALVHVMLGLC